MPESVSEHAVGADNLAAKPANQAPQEKSIVETVEECLKRSKRSTHNIRKKWSDNYDFIFGGRQWNIDRPSWRFSEVVNLSASTILTEVGIQTDARPKVEFSAEEPSDLPFAEIMKEIEDANWQKPGNRGFGWQQKLLEHVMDVKYCDISWAEVPWDPTLENGMGDAGWNVLDPEYCYWDPLAKDLSELRWFIYLEPTPTSQLRLQYPEKKEDIKADLHLIGDKSGGDLDYNVDRLWRSSHQGNDFQESYKSEDRFGGEQMSLKIRCWIRDTAVIEVEEEKKEKDGSVTKEFVQKLKYPKGRYVCMQGKTLLEDRENGAVINGKVYPYEDGQFPIACLVNYKLPRRLHGMSEAPFIRGPQKIVNYVWSFGLDHMKMAGNPKVTATRGAHDVVDKITNEPGVVIEVPTQDSVKFHPGEPMPAGYFNMLDSSQGLFDKVQGLGEVSRGTPEPSVTSGLQFDSYVEAAQTRPRLKNRNVDAFLGQVGYLHASRYLQFYTAPRVFRLTSKEGFPKFAEFFVSEDGKTASVQYSEVQGGQPVQGQPMQLEVKGIPDVRIEAGSSLPFARSQKNAMAQSALQGGAIDRLEYLKAIEWPNADSVDKRMSEKEAQAAQMQAQPKP